MPAPTSIKVPTDIEAKKKQLQDLVSKYSRMERWLDLDEIAEENKHLELHPKYIQLGHGMFVHKKQKEQGLRQVHQIHYRTLRDFQKGIETDEY